MLTSNQYYRFGLRRISGEIDGCLRALRTIKNDTSEIAQRMLLQLKQWADEAVETGLEAEETEAAK